MLALTLIQSVGVALVLLFGLGLSFALFTASANALCRSPRHRISEVA